MKADNKTKTISTLRFLLIEVSFERHRIIHGGCFTLICRMCGGTNANNHEAFSGKESYQCVQHTYFCPVGKILAETEGPQKGS